MQLFFIYLFLQTLYMFQAVPPSIIRSTYCTYSFRYCQPILLLAANVEEMELIQETLHLAGCNLELYYDARTNDYQTNSDK